MTTCAACHRHEPEHGLVCEPCRRWLPTALASIPRLADDARAVLIPADDSHTRRILVCHTCGTTATYTSDRRYARHTNPDHDNPEHKNAHAGFAEATLISHAGGPTTSIAPDMIITGGATEPATPINLHLHDLLADVIRDGGRPIDTTGDNWVQAITTQPRAIWVDNGHKGKRRSVVLDRKPAQDPNGYKVMVPAGDQIGEVPIAQILDQEVRAWIDHGAPGCHWRPTPTITNLIDWLTKRLHWACDNYPAMDEFAATLSRIRGQLMDALGEFDPEAELCDGIRCNRCDLRMLYRRDDGTGDVECQNPDCLKVFSTDEYRDWTRHLANEEHATRPETVAALRRV